MNYEITSIEGTGKDLIHRIMEARTSQLLIPEKLQGQDLHIPDCPGDGKYIGLFSSGSTGTPTCIWNKYEHLLQNARYTARVFQVHPGERLLMLAQPWHVAGLSWMLMAEQLDCPYEFITTQKGGERVWIHAIWSQNYDAILTVPGVLRSLYQEKWFIPKVIYGGYPIRNEEYELLRGHCDLMVQGYGQTEAGGLISCYSRKSSDLVMDDEHLCHGYPIHGTRLYCEGEPGDPRTIYIQSDTAYTQQRYDSGDVGYFDEEGRIYITGRKLPAKEASADKGLG